MKHRIAAWLVFSLSAQGCIVNQPLGARDDGASGDGASVEDARQNADALVTDATSVADGAAADASATLDSSAPDAIGPSDAGTLGDVVSGNLNVRYVDLTVSTIHPIPALGGALTSVIVTLRESAAAAGSTTVREIARGGDCVFNEVRPGPQVMPSLNGATITATASGRAPVALRRGSTGSTDNALATYSFEFSPALPVGTSVRIDVGAIGTMPSFSREIAVSDAQYVAPSPVTDTPSARYLTRTAGSPLALAWTLSGGTSTGVWAVPIITSGGALYDLMCTPAAGVAMTTIPLNVLDAMTPFVTTAVGGASALLYVRRESAEETLSNGTRVITRTSASVVAGTRW